MTIRQIPFVDSLTNIIQHHVNGYEPVAKDGARIVNRDWYLDPVKGKVVIIITYDDGQTETH